MAPQLQRLLLTLFFFTTDVGNHVIQDIGESLKRFASAGDCLIGADQALGYAVILHQRVQGRHIALQAAVGLDGNKAALGAQALALCGDDFQVVCIDFRHYHRNIRCHTVCAVVGNHRAFCLGVSFFQRFDFVLFHVDCTEHKIHLCSNFFHLGSIQNHHLFDRFRHRCFHQPAVADSILIGLACGACRCSQSRKLKPGMIFQQGNKTLAHHASCTNNANFVLFHLKLPSFPPEPQRTFGDSASVPSPIPLPICSCRRRFAGDKHKPAAALILFK